MVILKGILSESFRLLNEMSLYLLIGFLCAGILHIFISAQTVARHLGKGNLLSVIKASLFGVPLPLCSCGVIPAAMSLRREGASKGSTISFLISTPTTGVDSILATYALLGPVFAVYRVIASFTAGVFSGVLSNIFLGPDGTSQRKESDKKCAACGEPDCRFNHSFIERAGSVFHYAFVELLSGISKWLLLGILIGGIISFLIPDTFFRDYMGRGWQAMILMLIVGIPMYVCSTGSIPIAAALMFKGMSPGAAFVFLLAGPATNTVTITVVGRELGKKALLIYIVTISVSAILFGIILNIMWDWIGAPSFDFHITHKILPAWLKITATVILSGLIIYSLIRKRLNKGKEVGEETGRKPGTCH